MLRNVRMMGVVVEIMVVVVLVERMDVGVIIAEMIDVMIAEMIDEDRQSHVAVVVLEVAVIVLTAAVEIDSETLDHPMMITAAVAVVHRQHVDRGRDREVRPTIDAVGVRMVVAHVEVPVRHLAITRAVVVRNGVDEMLTLVRSGVDVIMTLVHETEDVDTGLRQMMNLFE
jgi:hypothetical protein